jgi:hypothetical protein
MYLELLTTVAVVQEDLSNAYIASGRMREVGIYFLTVNQATVALFEQIKPPEGGEHLHETFLKWQKLGIDALAEELKAGMPLNSEAAHKYADATKQYTEALASFAAAAREPARSAG